MNPATYMRTCSKCLVPKQLDRFNAAVGYRDGYQRQCKDCMKVARKDWRARGGLKKEASTPAAKERQLRYKRNLASNAPQRLRSRERAADWYAVHGADPKTKAIRRQSSAAYRALHRNAGPEPTQRTKDELMAEYGGVCAYCIKAKAKCLDHIVPLSAGGSNAIENRVPACTRCNNEKSDAPLLVFLARRKRSNSVGWSSGSSSAS